ncbi:MAG TPA: SDR family NAD(P)-dependent oxidoreductase [Kofleriaceae bacterium]|nr:SDR family NAD(P)-dependent oxidoreductase [Kofleriaceae bacterium]
MTFDVSVWDLFLPLVSGARLVMAAPEGHRDSSYLVEAIVREHITTVHFVPAMLRAFLAEPNIERCTSLRRVTCSGEALPAELVNAFVSRLPGVRLYNYYGPTEACVDVTFWRCDQAAPIARVPIGRPIENVSVHVLDAELQPVPVGIPGQLYIGGVCLARGYLHRPDENRRFVVSPWQPHERLYASGDRVRWLPDGTIEYLGRLDHQVKVRGFRIETGEVEAALGQCRGVREAVVVVQRVASSGDDLVAYVVPRPGQRAEPDELRAALRAMLPGYMVPAVIAVVDALPLTASGKVDRKQLPALRVAAAESASPAPRPASALELAISEIWQRVLGRTSVRRTENFFDLGGNSLLLVEVHRALEQQLSRSVARTDLFKYPTIESLAAALSTGSVTPGRSDVPGEPRASQPTGFAVIGMACRVPGARNLDEYWDIIQHGRRAIRELSESELLASGEPAARIARPDYVRAAAVIDGVDAFDAELFGFTPREAELTDPQHRVLLEVAWEALEHAGYGATQGRPRCAVFVGGLPSSYFQQYLNDDYRELPPVAHYQVKIGNEPDFLPTLIAYKLDLRGPAVAVHTACSTSLVAVHLACSSLARGECELAIAGGVSLRVPDRVGYLYQEGMVASRDGRCRAFDDAASGTVFGNGAGIAVLKRLEDAVRDRDRIFAVVRGSAVNNDGASKVGYTAPSVVGQVEVVRTALRLAGATADEIGYVEAHGTGTEMGDPIEVAALTEAFRATTGRNGFCALGSVKANIGHLDAAAGIAGFIKAVLAVDRGVKPGLVDLQRPSTRIPWADTPFHVSGEASPWPLERRRLAGVSSFGIGGTNAHVIVESPPVRAARVPRAQPWTGLFKLSARTHDALVELARTYVAHLATNPGLALEDICYTADVGRAVLGHRLGIVTSSVEELQAALQAFLRGRRERALFVGAPRAPSARTGFALCDGLDPAAIAAFEPLLAEPEVRDSVERCRAAFGTVRAGDDAAAWLTRASAVEQQFTWHYALAMLWRARGSSPVIVAGFGRAEIVAACVAGELELGAAAALATTASPAAIEQRPNGPPRIRAVIEAAIELGVGRLLLFGASSAPLVMHVREAAERAGLDTVLALAPDADVWRGFWRSAARLHVSGVDLDVSALAAMRAGRRTELPTYAFQRSRYWVERRARAQGAASGAAREGYTVLGRPLALPLSSEKRFEAVFRRTEPPYVDHHRLFGMMVVPGASHIAMVLAAAAELIPGPCALQDVLFLQPFGLSEHGARRAQLVLSPSGDARWEFRLVAQDEASGDEDGGWSILCSGTLARTAPAEPGTALTDEARAAIQQRCPGALSGQDFYRDVWVPGLDTGRSFHWIDTIWRGEDEALCLTRRPAIEVGDEPIHPGLVEAAFQVLNSCWKYDTEELRRTGDIYVPFSVDRYSFSGRPAGDALWVHAQLVGHETAADESFTARVRMYAPSGELVVAVDRFESRRIQRARVEQALAGPRAGIAHAVRWQRAPLADSCARRSRESAFLIGAEPAMLERFAGALEARGVHAVRVVPASHGGLRRRDDGILDADLRSVATIDRLCSEPPAGSRSIGWIDLRGMAAGSPTAATADQAARDGAARCAGALELVDALRGSRLAADHRLWWITRGAQAVVGDADVCDPLAATLWGVATVVRIECPSLRCTTIDLDGGDEGAVIAELLADGDELRVAYRSGERYAARLHRVEERGGAARIRRDRSYVVTGGLDGIGLRVAAWLAAQGAGHLVLCARRSPSEQARAAIRTMQAHGCSVDAVQADVSRAAEVDRLQTALRDSRLPLGGIVHAAGVLDDGVIGHLDAQRFERVLLPKVAGALHLAAIAGDALDFFVCFSSLSATLGAGGQASYAAANAFLDAFAHALRARGLPATAIAWGPWSEVGMAARRSPSEQKRARDRGLHELSPEQALQLLGQRLAIGPAVVVAARIDWTRYVAASGIATEPFLATVVPRAAAAARPAPDDRPLLRRAEAALPGERRDLIRALVTDEVRNVLGRAPGDLLDPERGFVDLGMDSLSVVDLRSRLQHGFGIRLMPTFGFDHPTIAAAAAFLVAALELEAAPPASPPDAGDDAIEVELALLERALGPETSTVDR